MKRPKERARPRKPREANGGSSRSERIYLELRDLIRAGDLKPGQRVIEVDLAERFGVSRTPVRDALQHLIADGLISVGVRRGLVVTELDSSQIVELYALREMLEGFAARLAARHAAEAEVDAMREILAREAAQRDPAQLATTNRQFHQAVHRAARNRFLTAALNGLRDALALLRSTTFSVPGRPGTALEEHRQILDAITRGDGDVAEATMRAHIRAAQSLRMRMILEEATPADPRGKMPPGD
ncbi:MAG TPA: GntR family transcriptional regulator [Candidatus Limnocylindria bacterium]|nr:GntR family transcriptional regulator [Candidatus Limnocylindria bacterium]